jgi:hypothetical protein
MARLFNLRRIQDNLRQLRRVRAEGGPRRVRLERLERPAGWIFPTSEATVAIETNSGAEVRLTPELPVPWPYAWGYRLARRLGLPIAATLDPEDVSVSLPVPDFVGRRLSQGSS